MKVERPYLTLMGFKATSNAETFSFLNSKIADQKVLVIQCKETNLNVAVPMGKEFVCFTQRKKKQFYPVWGDLALV